MSRENPFRTFFFGNEQEKYKRSGLVLFPEDALILPAWLLTHPELWSVQGSEWKRRQGSNRYYWHDPPAATTSRHLPQILLAHDTNPGDINAL